MCKAHNHTAAGWHGRAEVDADVDAACASSVSSAVSAATPSRPWPARVMARIIVAGVMVYRVTLSPWLGGHCRFYPTCSQYMIEAVDKHGPLRGVCKGLWRIARCQPLGGKGYDPP